VINSAAARPLFNAFCPRFPQQAIRRRFLLGRGSLILAVVCQESGSRIRNPRDGRVIASEEDVTMMVSLAPLRFRSPSKVEHNSVERGGSGRSGEGDRGRPATEIASTAGPSR
jgi:hypothetical protein